MKKTLLLLSAISMSAFLSGCGPMDHGNPPPPPPHSDNWQAHKDHMNMMTEYYFDQMDANQDGVVSRREFMDFQRKMFQQADTNHDGNLTLDEVKAAKWKEMQKMKAWMRDHNDDTHSGMNTPDNGMHDDTAGDMNRDRY